MLTTGKDDVLARELRARGYRVTPQRLLIHRALRDLDRHVTAEEVLAAVAGRLPGLSAPTVYSTLALFEQLGIVRRISPGEGPVLYDPRAEDHHHLVCVRCGRVEDVDADVDATRVVAAAKRQGFSPARADVVVSGLCEICARRSSERRRPQGRPVVPAGRPGRR